MKYQRTNYWKFVVLKESAIMIFLLLNLFEISLFSQTSEKYNSHFGLKVGFFSNCFTKENLGNESLEMHISSKLDYGFKLIYSHSLFNGKSNLDIAIGMITNSFTATYNFLSPIHPQDTEILSYHNFRIFKPLINSCFSFKSYSKNNIFVTHGIGIGFQYNSLKHLYTYRISSKLNNNYTVFNNEMKHKGLKYDIFDIKSMFRNQFYLLLNTNIYFLIKNTNCFIFLTPQILTNLDCFNESVVVSSYKFTWGVTLGFAYKIEGNHI